MNVASTAFLVQRRGDWQVVRESREHMSARREVEIMTIEEKWEMVRELGPAAAAYEQRIHEMIKRGKQFFDDNPEFGTFEINIAQNNDTLIVGTVWDALAAGFIVADARGRRVIEAVCGEPANQKAPTITMLDLALDQIFRDNNARSFSA